MVVYGEIYRVQYQFAGLLYYFWTEMECFSGLVLKSLAHIRIHKKSYFDFEKLNTRDELEINLILK